MDNEQLFEELIRNLRVEQDELYKKLLDKVNRENFPKTTQNIKIFTYLIDLSDKNNEKIYEKGFSPIINEQEEILFLNCKYTDFDMYLNQEYTGIIEKNGQKSEISYKFSKIDSFVQAEKVLSKTLLQNDMKKPYIYSPYSRRAVEIILDKDDIDGDIDYQLEKNGLKNVLMENYELAWNVIIEEKDTFPYLNENTNKKATIFDETIYQIYQTNLKSNEYIYVRNEKSQTRKIDNEIYIALDKDVSFDNFLYSKIKINQNVYHSNEIFENIYDDSTDFKQRIVTSGDIEYIINKFAKLDINFEGFSINKPKTMENILVYNKDDEYIYSKDLKLRKSNLLYLKFGNNDDFYFNDKISYILSFLNYYYPEYYFVGVM